MDDVDQRITQAVAKKCIYIVTHLEGLLENMHIGQFRTEHSDSRIDLRIFWVDPRLRNYSPP